MKAGAGVATLAGLALALGHAFVVPVLLEATARPPLELRWPGPLVADAPAIATAPTATAESGDGGAPGLVWRRWTVTYRGGVTRAVGAVQLVGPFQDPAAPPCAGRLVVGQRLLDDGRGEPATVAGVIAAELTRELTGSRYLGAGAFRRVEDVRAAWAELASHPRDVALFPRAALAPPAPTGYLRATAVVVFDRVRIPVTIGALPRVDVRAGAPSLGFVIGVRAALDFDHRALDWLNDRVGGDRLVTRAVSGQLDTALLAALGPPPPLELPGGRQLVVELCPDRPLEIREGAWAAVPLRWRLGGPVAVAAGGPPVRPPARGAARFAAPAGADLTLDLDLDALNGVLYELWRTGWLDEQLDRAAAHDRFNRDPTVATYLRLRLSPLRLALPPTVRPAGGARLALDLAVRVDLADGPTITPGHAWASLALGLGAGLAAEVGVTALELACEPAPGLHRPCYADVVAALRDAAPGAHALLADPLTGALTGLFAARRLSATGAPAALELSNARARVAPDGEAIRIELDGRLAPD